MGSAPNDSDRQSTKSGLNGSIQEVKTESAEEEHHDHHHETHNEHKHTVIHHVRSKHPPHRHKNNCSRKHLVARPRARQYFTADGDLHKEADDGLPRVAGKFELFLDLLYIGLCANFAEDCIHHPTDPNFLLKYILIFIPAWRIWTDLVQLMNMYFNDDLIQRGLIAWIMVLMTFYGNNAIYVDTSISALRMSVGSYVLARFTLAIVKLVYSLTATHHAFQLRAHNFLVLCMLPLWTPLFLDSVSVHAKIALAVVLFLLEQLVGSLCYGPIFARFFRLKTTTAVDIEHHIDRMTAFFIVVLGEFLYGLVWASPSALDGPFQAKSVRAAVSLSIAFCLCWLYCSTDGSRENLETGVHALRWRAVSGMLWILMHLPLSAALLVAGDICAVFVKYGDGGAEVVKPAGGVGGVFPTLDDIAALKWLFCGGLAIGLACLWIICCLHHEADEDECTKDKLLLTYRIRRAPRLFVSAIIACLPVSNALNITELMTTTLVLLIFVVLWETLGSLDRNNWRFLESHGESTKRIRKMDVVCPLTLQPLKKDEGSESDSGGDTLAESEQNCSCNSTPEESSADLNASEVESGDTEKEVRLKEERMDVCRSVF